MGAVTTRNIWIADQALAALNDNVDGCMTTAEIATAIGVEPWKPDTWRVLDRLARHHQIERSTNPADRSLMWRALQKPIPTTMLAPQPRPYEPRGRPMSQDPRWTAETEVAITGVIRNSENGSCSCNACAARAVLAALADAGLLMPAGGEVHWATTDPDDPGQLVVQPYNPSPECVSGGRLHDDCDNDLGCTCGCHTNGTSGTQGDEPAAPRVWAMPEEPGPKVTRVRDVYGQTFTRDDGDEHGSVPAWLGDAFADEDDIPDLHLPWKELLAELGPLTEVMDGSQT